MVYDESKNYIGDSHWREEEELQEGTDLKLDKGVLVDVGERLGQTETDLAPLLEKRRPENGSSPVRAPLRPISLSSTLRTNLGHSQALPKSLSAVLGLSQGPIGRARLPVQSPYEQLHRVTEAKAHEEEPAAKRPRVSLGKEKGESNESRAVGQKQLVRAVRTANTSSNRARSQLPRQKADLLSKDVIDISSEEDMPVLPSSFLEPTSKRTNTSKKINNPVMAKPVSSIHSRLTTKSQLSAAPASTTRTLDPKPCVSKHPAVSSAVSRDASSPSISKSKLRLAVHKPRKKLMYSDLLPSSKEYETQHEGGAPKQTSVAEPHRRPDASRSRSSVLSLTQVQELINVGSENMITPLRGGNMEKDMENNLADLFAQQSSPLFMPQSPARMASQVSEPPSPGGFLPPSPLTYAPHATKPSSERTTAPEANVAIALVEPPANSAAHSVPLSRLTILDQQLLIPPPKPAVPASVISPISPKPRLFRRVMSENDSPAYTRTSEAAAALAAPASPTSPHLVSPSIRQSAIQKLLKNTTKLTKSLSDGAVKPKDQQLPLAVDTASDTEVEQDSGVWSKVESFLLFDWHPPGRERLMLDGYKLDDLGRTVMKRSFLSDQIDVL